MRRERAVLETPRQQTCEPETILAGFRVVAQFLSSLVIWLMPRELGTACLIEPFLNL